MRSVRIFISSPGDVAEERDRARQVIESLRRRYAEKFHLQPLLWEDLPLQPDMSFQQGIDLVLSQDRGLDIAVFILWSRLGSPVGPLIEKPGGGQYRSGTEREYDLMMQARARSKHHGGEPRPAILIYTRADNPSFDERLRGRPIHEQKNLLAQKELVEQFIVEEFKDAATGTNLRAYHSFDRPVAFSQRLRTHLTEILDQFAGGTAEVIWDTATLGSPFVGLESFQPKHANVFFGREEEILEARHALREQARNGCAFLLISGASGSGKSSLARAGVLPAIVENEIDEHIAAWRTVIVTPADLAPDPIASLVRLLAADDVLPDLGSYAPTLDAIAAGLSKDPSLTFDLRIKDAFVRAAQRQNGGIRLLLVIDQFEEFYASTAISADDRAAFFFAVEAFVRSGYSWAVGTVRSDFYSHVQAEPSLVRLKSGRGQIHVLPPGPDALRRLIEEPARLAGLTFESRDGQSLADHILRDAAAHAELLPLVEFVLRELYEQRTAAGQLTFAAYDALGGVEGALGRRAESAFGSLPGDSQECLATVLQSLVTLGNESDNPNDTDRERLVRQHAPLRTFAQDSAARRFVDTFITMRLFTSDQPGPAAEPSVTVAHESLLRAWPRAARWAEQNRDFLRTRARVAARITEGSPLLEGDPLLEAAKAHLARQHGAFTEPQRNYIQHAIGAAEHARKRKERIRRRVTAGLAILSLLAVSGLIGTLILWRQSLANENAARDSARRATEAEANEKVRANQLAQTNVQLEASVRRASEAETKEKDRAGELAKVNSQLRESVRRASEAEANEKAKTAQLAKANTLLQKSEANEKARADELAKANTQLREEVLTKLGEITMRGSVQSGKDGFTCRLVESGILDTRNELLFRLIVSVERAVNYRVLWFVTDPDTALDVRIFDGEDEIAAGLLTANDGCIDWVSTSSGEAQVFLIRTGVKDAKVMGSACFFGAREMPRGSRESLAARENRTERTGPSVESLLGIMDQGTAALAKSDFATAVSSFNWLRTTIEGSVTDASTKRGMLSALRIKYVSLGDAAMARKDAGIARRAYESATAIALARATTEGASLQASRELALSFKQLGAAQLAFNELGEAHLTYQRMHVAARKLVNRLPEWPIAAALLGCACLNEANALQRMNADTPKQTLRTLLEEGAAPLEKLSTKGTIDDDGKLQLKQLQAALEKAR